MELLDPDLDLGAFWAAVAGARRPVLMLDYDGTLAPFRARRMEARPYPWVAPILRAVVRGRTRVVIISGRVVEEVVELLGLGEQVEVWGSHGMERLDARGRLHRHREPAGVAGAIHTVEEWARREGVAARLERKPGCLALHLRGLPPDDAAALRQMAQGVMRRAEASVPALRLTAFDGGLELRERGCDKGVAVATILAEEPGAPAAFLGDDLTDEDGFRAIRGRGLGVLVRGESRDTAASLRLEPPGELRWFLEQWRMAAEGEQ